ncbi:MULTISPECIES: glycosyltransferase family 4 protein [unclassified Spirillospora]|uniref:glycosyltransferase family 4 protein n=1 Tax=unclassified Spirillospora TaxID=2642701 RepID=UPI003715F025
MEIEDGSGPSASRGRIVMIVDNGVTADSRVQKAAHSAAAAGWEVHLIGRAPGKKSRSWMLGDAHVRLIPVPMTLGDPRRVVRAQLRRPLAYSDEHIAEYRRRLVQSRRADLAAGRLALTSGASSPRALWLMARRVAAKLQDRWVALRERQTESLAKARRDLHSPLERLAIRFWQKLLGDRCWRVLDRTLWDWEIAYGKVIDKLRPDIIHANDFRMLGVGARAARRARAAGRDVKLVWDAHEFLPGISPWRAGPRWLPAMCAHEREYSGVADEVLTVSEALGDLLVERHGLGKRPTIVLNAPVTEPVADGAEPTPDEAGPVPSLRELCGVGPETPLAVYSGAAAVQRGLDVMVETLPKLPDLHVALVVSKPNSDYVQGLLARAAELGVADRVTALGYVPFDQVVEFLSAADFGVIPIHHWPNHEIALITKFFEYSHARLPIIVSDVKAMGEMVQATGQGEVFRADDAADYLRAAEAVLADPDRYRGVYDSRPELLREWTWEAQAEVLDGVYARLLPSDSTRTTASPAGLSA